MTRFCSAIETVRKCDLNNQGFIYLHQIDGWITGNRLVATLVLCIVRTLRYIRRLEHLKSSFEHEKTGCKHCNSIYTIISYRTHKLE